ncbi:MAG: calcium/sodium antiporter [Bacteriovoracaceae bacterium]|nr:calcium/sodium antiporter [Bacteriovoracaceae bacterium]
MVVQALLLALSIVVLYIGAETALNSAEKIGKFYKLPPLVIGLLIVGFGTSLPEFFVSQIACLNDHSPIALGNIVGSNIANLFLILGVAGILAPLKINSKSLKCQFSIHLLLTILMTVVLLQKELYVLSAVALGGFFVFYLYYTFVRMQKHNDGIEVDDDPIDHLSPITFIKLIAGFAFLYIGGELLVSSGSKLGESWGIPEYVISAIFIAFGTSFPELVTSLVACFKRKHTDLIVGNVIGSNVFNVAMVLGSLGGYKVMITQSFVVEQVVLIMAAVFLLALAYAGKLFHRFAGVFFICCYLGMVFHWIS